MLANHTLLSGTSETFSCQRLFGIGNDNVVLVTHLRTSLDLVMSDIHFAKQIIVEKIPCAVTLDP